jgi:hypothetical protein
VAARGARPVHGRRRGVAGLVSGLSRIGFERTLRLPDDGKAYPLPPDLGSLPVRRVADFAGRVPAAWLGGGPEDLFLPLHDREALFLTFTGAAWKPCAVKVGVGGVNAVSGEPWHESLSADPQDYLVCPPQPWLDGINSGDGSVRQFVAVPLGRGHTVEAQITGEEKVGGLQILVFDPRPGRFPDQPPPEPERDGAADLELAGLEGVAPREPTAMGLGAGGQMRQKIYPDPHGAGTWEASPSLALHVHLVRAGDWQALTGEEPPPTPVSAELYTAYGLPWFALDDGDQGDIAAPSTLTRVKSVQSIQEEMGGETGADEPSAAVPDALVVGLGRPGQAAARADSANRSQGGPDAMKNAELIARSKRLLPNLEQVLDTLRTTPAEELLNPALDVRSPEAGLESGLESFTPGTEEVSPAAAAGLPRNALVEGALQAQREATLEAGRRGIERILDHGDDADLTVEEQSGVEAIILVVGRPALLIQNGEFFPPPADWRVLEEHRDRIQRTFHSVGRIEVTGHPELEWIGTGFLVAPDVLMTNRHVAVEFTAPRGNGRWGIAPGMTARVDFKEELGSTESAQYAITGLIGIHGRFDMSLFRIARTGGADGAAAAPDPLPLAADLGPSAALPGREVYVVGYPAWDGRRNDPEPMQRLFSNIYNVKRLQPGRLMSHFAGSSLFTHDCSTLGGNSGSCVLDLETHRVIGLHFGGRFQQENQAVALWQLQQDPLIQFAKLSFG